MMTHTTMGVPGVPKPGTCEYVSYMVSRNYHCCWNKVANQLTLRGGEYPDSLGRTNLITCILISAEERDPDSRKCEKVSAWCCWMEIKGWGSELRNADVSRSWNRQRKQSLPYSPQKECWSVDSNLVRPISDFLPIGL